MAVVNNNRCRSKPLFTSEGLIGRCRGQTASEEDSPSYKQGPFSQQWDNESHSVCLFVFACDAVRSGEKRFKTFLHVDGFYVIVLWVIQTSDVCFMWFHVVNTRWKSFLLRGSERCGKRKRHSDSTEFNSITLKGNKSKDKILDSLFPSLNVRTFPFNGPNGSLCSQQFISNIQTYRAK